MKHIVVSFIGPDRPGLVDALSNTINKYQGNWQTSSMHHLSGFFAGVIEIAVEAQHADTLVSEIKSITDLNSQIETASPHSESQPANLTLELTANDRVGIVQEISSVIHHQGGNLLKLISTQDSAPHSALIMFKAKALVSIAEDHIDDLIEAIEDIADDIMVDISR